MKTPIEELIEFIDDKFVVSNSPQISSIYNKAQELLEKEKEQIIDFHVMLMKNGLEQEGNAIEWDYNELKEEALKFYNQKYNQNK